VALEKLFQGMPTVEFGSRFRCKVGSYRRLAWTAMPTPEGLVYAVARDLTVERSQSREKRAQLLARQPVAALARREGFLASVCHDVQQPLTVIKAHTQVLQRQLTRGETLPPEQLTTCLAYILAATDRVQGMIQDLLDDSVQPSRALLLARTDLIAVPRKAVGEHALVSDRHHFLFEAEMPTLGAIIDEARVHRVLAKLLTNAIKYSPKGGVRVTVKVTDGPDDKSALLVVRDEGVGIPQHDVPHIFDRFHRAGNVVGRFAGAGLGLASARDLVELHGGTISVESEEGKGSTFVVRLPLVPPADARLFR
jgi:signal transduction histidine kinase